MSWYSDDFCKNIVILQGGPETSRESNLAVFTVEGKCDTYAKADLSFCNRNIILFFLILEYTTGLRFVLVQSRSKLKITVSIFLDHPVIMIVSYELRHATSLLVIVMKIHIGPKTECKLGKK